MESVGDARAFLSAVREVALSKPVILIKAGRTGRRARRRRRIPALTGSDDVLDAALRRCGVLRVETSPNSSTWRRRWPSNPGRGPRLTIVTNAGGPGVLADRRAVRRGAARRALGETIARSTRSCPPTGARQPGRRDRRRRRRSATRMPLEIVAHDPQRRIAGDPHPAGDDRPDSEPPSACPLGSGRGRTNRSSRAGWVERRSRQAKRFCTRRESRPSPIPTPQHLVISRACGVTVRDLQSLYETPAFGRTSGDRADRGRARARPLRRAQAEGRTPLDRTPDEGAPSRVRYLLRRDAHRLVTTPEAIEAAEKIGLPGRPRNSIRTRSRTRATSGACISTWATPTAVREALSRDQGIRVGPVTAPPATWRACRSSP